MVVEVAADITYLRCWEGVGFFAFVLDALSRRVVGWQLAGHMRTTLVLDALRMALHQRGGGADVELVHPATEAVSPGSSGRRNTALLFRERVGALGLAVIGLIG